MIPIKEEIINQSFEKEKDLHNQMKVLANQSPDDSFWAHNIEREFYEDGEHTQKIGDVWRCDFLVNGNELVEAYSIWRNYPNYHSSGDGKSMDEVLEASETEKILYWCNEYRIVLLRDIILPGTDTYWGFRIQRPVYALIDNKTNDILVREKKDWRFRKILMDDLHEQESKSFIDDLKKRNPFKLFIVSMNDKECMEYIQDKLEMSIDTPTNRFSDYLNEENRWVCYALGHNRPKRGYINVNCTWWFIDNKIKKPTYEEAILELYTLIDWYDADDYIDMLKKYKDKNYDLNLLDIREIEFLWTQVKDKLAYSCKDIFGVNKIEDFLI